MYTVTLDGRGEGAGGAGPGTAGADPLLPACWAGMVGVGASGVAVTVCVGVGDATGAELFGSAMYTMDGCDKFGNGSCGRGKRYPIVAAATMAPNATTVSPAKAAREPKENLFVVELCQAGSQALVGLGGKSYRSANESRGPYVGWLFARQHLSTAKLRPENRPLCTELARTLHQPAWLLVSSSRGLKLL